MDINIHGTPDETSHETASRLVSAIVRAISIAQENPNRTLTREELATLLDLIDDLNTGMNKNFTELMKLLD